MSNPSRGTEVAPRVALSDEQSDITHAAACARGARIDRRFRDYAANFNWEFTCSSDSRCLPPCRWHSDRIVGVGLALLPVGGNGLRAEQQVFQIVEVDVKGFAAFGNGLIDISA